MLKNNAVALPVQTSSAVVRGILSAGGLLLGLFSGVIQRCLGGTGFKLQKELCDVLGLLLQAFAIDVPNIIIDQFSHQRARTTTDYLALREKIQTHHAEYILRHEKTVLELERQAAKWNAAGPQSIYNDINQAMQDIQNKCANAAIDLLLKKT